MFHIKYVETSKNVKFLPIFKKYENKFFSKNKANF